MPATISGADRINVPISESRGMPQQGPDLVSHPLESTGSAPLKATKDLPVDQRGDVPQTAMRDMAFQAKNRVAPARDQIPAMESVAGRILQMALREPDPERDPLADPLSLGTTALSGPLRSGDGALQPPAADRPQVAVGSTLVEMARTTRRGPVEIALSPEELGGVRLQLHPRGDHIHVTLAIERPETMAMMRRSVDEFAAQLRDAGYSGASFSFSGWTGQDAPRPAPDMQDRPVPVGMGLSSGPTVVAPSHPRPMARTDGLDLRL